MELDFPSFGTTCNPIADAVTYDAATEVAAYLLSNPPVSATAADGVASIHQATLVLAMYLTAAQVAGRSARDAAHWLANPHDDEPLRILRAHPGHVPTYDLDLLTRNFHVQFETSKARVWSIAQYALTSLLDHAAPEAKEHP